MSRLVVISNRVPVPEAGKQAGGLAVVLGGLMEKRGGLWFGWDGSISDDAGPQKMRMTHAQGVDYATVSLTRDEHDRYYNGFSNGVLWPLLHTMPELVRYDRDSGRVYRDVNARLARTVLPLLQPSDLVWVHDYHLLPLAAVLREQGVRNPIGFFLHIPFPGADVLATVPDMTGLVRSMLAADLVGFQTEGDLSNFATAAEHLAGASRVHGNLLIVGGRRVRLGVFPVEIDAPAVARMAADLGHCAALDSLRASLGQQRLVFGAERLDPTKGLLQRIAGYRRLLETEPSWRRRVTMLQIAATSRKDVSAYQSLRTALDQDAGALNADLGDPDWTPLRLTSRNVDRALVAAYMRHSDVGLVTPLRDGMNLVAKEYVAAQDPENPGVLVLSGFAGAVHQLDAALIVNPHDAEGLAQAIQAALTMPLAERRTRWHAMWAAISDRSPLAWGESFLAALGRAPAFELDRIRHVSRMAPVSGRRSVDVVTVPPLPAVADRIVSARTTRRPFPLN